MPACPSCNAEVDAEADLCLGCGEPLGDSPAARAVRAESAAAAPPSDGRVRAAAPPARPTIAATPRARKRAEEADPVRCPGCGVPSRAARCPGCGVVLRHED